MNMKADLDSFICALTFKDLPTEMKQAILEQVFRNMQNPMDVAREIANLELVSKEWSPITKELWKIAVKRLFHPVQITEAQKQLPLNEKENWKNIFRIIPTLPPIIFNDFPYLVSIYRAIRYKYEQGLIVYDMIKRLFPNEVFTFHSFDSGTNIATSFHCKQECRLNLERGKIYFLSQVCLRFPRPMY